MRSRVLREFIRLELDEGPRTRGLAALALMGGLGASAINHHLKDLSSTGHPAVQRTAVSPKDDETGTSTTATKTSSTAARRYSRTEIVRAMQRAAKKQGLPVAFVDAIIRTESNYNQDAISNKGAIGLMQLMPATAEKLGVDPNDPMQNITGGTRYLKQLYDMFDGDLELTAAAYNAGPRNVRQFDGVPPFKETQDYVEIVIARMADSTFEEGRVV